MENKKINDLGIFELRNVARGIGVKSPTTLKREQLITEINLILNGEKEKYVRKNRQGRPPKNITNMGEIMSMIFPSTFPEAENDTEQILDNKFVFNDNVIDVEEDIETEYFKSIIKFSSDNSYAIAFKNIMNESKENVIMINKSQIELYGLKNGDLVTGRYFIMPGPCYLKEISSINGERFTKKAERADFKTFPAYFSDKKLKLSIYKDDDKIFSDIDLYAPIAKGQRVALIGKKDKDLNYEIIKRLSLPVNNLVGLAVMVDDSPEEYYELNGNLNQVEVISNNYNNNNDFIVELTAKIEHIQRLVEMGRDVVLYINDIIKLYNYLVNSNLLLKQTKEQAFVNAENKLKNIILLGKNSREKGSLTVICGLEDAALKLLSNQSTIYIFKNLFNNLVVYEKAKVDYMLDKDNCETKNIEKILTKTELNLYKQN